MRKIVCLFVFYTLFLGASTQAALITVNDGDIFNYDVGDTYQFLGALSSSNTILTYGVNVDPGEIMSFVVSAPVEFDLQATLSTGPNGTGTGIITPNGTDLVYSGTSYDFLIDGNFFMGLTHWLTVGIGSDAIPIIDNIYGGALDITSISSGDSFVPIVDDSGDGAAGAGNGSNSVPEPSTILLFSIALLGFASVRRKM